MPAYHLIPVDEIPRVTRSDAGKPGRLRLFTPEQAAYIRRIVKGRSYADIAERVNVRFGTSFTPGQIASFIGNHGLNTGRTGRFEKGHVSHNKGHKGLCPPGSEKGWFQPGGFSHNRVAIGTERITREGYVEVKYRDGHGVRNWRGKHLLVWEAEHGPIPRGSCLIFVDGDPAHWALDNLILIERAVLARMNKAGTPRGDREIVEAAIALARLSGGIAEAKRRRKTEGRSCSRTRKERS